jgi:hypothetical protein
MVIGTSSLFIMHERREVILRRALPCIASHDNDGEENNKNKNRTLFIYDSYHKMPLNSNIDQTVKRNIIDE